MVHRDEYYYETFIILADYSYKAAQLLIDTMIDYHPDALKRRMGQMYSIGQECNDKRRAMVEKLAKEFITPIEREDIMLIAHKIDNVTDCIRDVLVKMYMFNVLIIREDALGIAYIVEKFCMKLKDMLMEFYNFRKSHIIHGLIRDIDSLKREGNNFYTEATRRLHISDMEPLSIVSWTRLLYLLKKCCDACGEVSYTIESAIIKNA